MCLLTAGCEMKSRSAVRVKLSVRAAVMKTLSRKSSITFQINETASFAATGGIWVHDGPKTGNRTRLPRAHRNRSGHRGPAKAIRQAPEAMQPKSGGGNRQKGNRQPKSGAEPTAKRLTTKNRTNKSRCKGDRQPKSGAETAAKRLTAGNRSAETIDNRKSGRRELPETAAARPLRRISRDGPRRRTPLPT